MGVSVQDSTQCTHYLSYNRLNVLHLTLNCTQGRYPSVQQGYKVYERSYSSFIHGAESGTAGCRRSSCPADQVTGQQDSRGYTDGQDQGHRQTGRQSLDTSGREYVASTTRRYACHIEIKLPRVMYLHASKHRGQDEY
jgi:hypothetical protein